MENKINGQIVFKIESDEEQYKSFQSSNDLLLILVAKLLYNKDSVKVFFEKNEK